jgi:putative N6-adenine-specific DNA methylase
MTLSLDASWHSLHKRGYRPIQTRAPLNEALAAALLMHLRYDGSEPLADPLCGSGGLTRPWFGFQGWMDFDPTTWNAERERARQALRAELRHPVVGSDIRHDAIEFTRTNANAAGLGPQIGLALQDVFVARPPCDVPGLILCNPPYGERLGEERELIFLYATIGEVTQRHWPGWRLAIFTSNDFLARMVGRKVKRQSPFFNGGIPCKLWEYDPS